MDIFLYVIKLNDEGEEISREDMNRRRNELLDLYSLYLKTGIQSLKEETILKAYEIHLRDPEFSFII